MLSRKPKLATPTTIQPEWDGLGCSRGPPSSELPARSPSASSRSTASLNPIGGNPSFFPAPNAGRECATPQASRPSWFVYPHLRSPCQAKTSAACPETSRGWEYLGQFLAGVTPT